MFWDVGYQNVLRTLLWCSGCLQEIVKAPETVVFLISNLYFWGGVICCHKTRRDQVVVSFLHSWVHFARCNVNKWRTQHEQMMVSFLHFSVHLFKSCASGKVSLFCIIYSKHYIRLTKIYELNFLVFWKIKCCFLFVTIATNQNNFWLNFNCWMKSAQNLFASVNVCFSYARQFVA